MFVTSGHVAFSHPQPHHVHLFSTVSTHGLAVTLLQLSKAL
jgi:hypothetical protein